MEYTGNGAVFSDTDLTMCKRLVGLLNNGRFTLDAKQTLEAAQAMTWLTKSMLKAIEDNVKELIAVSKPTLVAAEKKEE